MFNFVHVVCCVGSGHCDELICRSGESYRVCDLETSTMKLPAPDLACSATEKKSG
jgi:hypothetical protein